jgi:DNA-binding protein HU-beta
MAGKAELVDKIAELTGLPKTKVALCYDYLFEEMGKVLQKEGKVSVPSFGTFQVTTRAARQGRNPATGKAIKIAASKSVRFKVSKNLKEQL